MKLLGLTLINFMGHSVSDLDLSDLHSALIVGRKVGNELIANAVGKSSLFKAIEYVLFNECGAKLDSLIRDGEEKASVILIFSVDDKEFKLERIRHIKGQTDLSLFQKDNGVWKDISSRRPSDTEKDLAKLIKLNFTSFRNTAHFVQQDMKGLATNTPEQRKAILKEGLNLSIYPKLEKIAKEKASVLEKSLDKKQTLFDSFSLTEDSLVKIQKSIVEIIPRILFLSQDYNSLKESSAIKKKELVALQEQLDELSKGREEYLRKDASLKRQCDQWSVKISAHQALSRGYEDQYNQSVHQLHQKQNELSLFVLGNGEELLAKCLSQEIELQNLLKQGERQKVKVETLSLPLTEESTCSHCRQLVSEEYRNQKELEIEQELVKEKEILLELKKQYVVVKNALAADKVLLEEYKIAVHAKDKLNQTILSITSSLKEQEERKALRKDTEDGLVASLIETQSFLKKNEKLIEASDDTELLLMKKTIDSLSGELQMLSSTLRNQETELSSLKNQEAILIHESKTLEAQLVQKAELFGSIAFLRKEFEVHQEVIRAFSSTGIPNLIIQNILDDLQTEANFLLGQIKPELSLVFSTEKENSKGEIVDKLEIVYYVEGKERDYSLLSGAQSVSVRFALKLGFSHLLQRMMGINLEFLLIDEVDESLDKASVDDFANIIKTLSKDVLVMVITHNDRLKDKFSTAIMVEQDMNRISTASVISW